MNARQSLFVKEYLVDLNATRAAIAAGYSERTAESQASRLLRNVNVKQEVDKRMEKRAEKLEITAEYVLGKIKDTVERCSQAFELSDKEGRRLGIFQFDANAVLKGCELLGKHKKLFTDKIESSGPNGGPIRYADLSSLSDEQIAILESAVSAACSIPSTGN
jgi:phage terminase small subunit